MPLLVLFLIVFLSYLTGAYNLQNPQDWCTKKLIEIRKRRREKPGIDDDDDRKKALRIED
jgi:uncharacterized membrane protein